ncbi:MAG: ABC transporter permease [Halanaerobiales bacterium]|nr:ABC transporter permease [Halanaerobiales bacterium]
MSREVISERSFEHIGITLEKTQEIRRPNLTYWQDAWRRLKQNRVALLGLIIIIIYILLAIFGPLIVSYQYQDINPARMNQFISKEHWFGTDRLGRDLWVRNWMGARISLSIGFIATIINAFIGAVLGSISGYYGGKLDLILMRIIDVLYGIPYIIVAILVMVVLGAGIKSLIIALVIIGWIGSTRFARGQVLQLKEQDFVASAKVLGSSDFKIIFKHILPNMIGLLVTNLTMAVPRLIFAEAFLSYIGIGIKPPECSWGSLAKAGAEVFRVYPYQMFIPAFFVSTTMLALNLLGDGLRDALDPKFRGLLK